MPAVSDYDHFYKPMEVPTLPAAMDQPLRKLANIIKILFQPLSDKHYQQSLTILGHLFFITFIAYSFIFYQERLINFDSAFFTFKLLSEQTFYAAHGRTVSYFAQIPTLLAIKMGWSLKSVMLVYSNSFMFFYYACFLIIRYVFKNPQAGILLALNLCLSFRYKYFTAISEITASLGLVALTIAYLSKEWAVIAPRMGIGAQNKQNLSGWLAQRGVLNIRYWLLSFGLLLVTVWMSHKFALIPVMIYLGYEFFFNHQWRSRAFRWLLVGFVVAIILSLSVVKTGSYEDQQINRLSEAWLVLSNLSDYHIWTIIKDYFNQELAFPAVVFLAGIAWLCYQKKWRPAGYFLLANLGVMVLVVVHNSYLQGDVLFMVDGYIGYFGVVWALFFYLYYLRAYQNWFLILLTSALLIFSLHRIYQKHEIYQQRIHYYQQIIQEHATPSQRKFVFHKRHFSWEKMWLPDFMKYESLLVSALDGPENACHIIIAYSDQMVKEMEQSRTSLRATKKIEELPLQYFRFGDEGYLELTDLPWE